MVHNKRSSPVIPGKGKVDEGRSPPPWVLCRGVSTGIVSGTALRYNSLKSRGEPKFANFVFGSLKGFQESDQKETSGLEGLRASETPPSSPEATVPEAAAAAAATARIPARLRLLLSSSSIFSQTGKTLFKFAAGLVLCAKLGLEDRTPSRAPFFRA
ncbi:hypothetical protein LEMLEM_LOCUS7589 [Lemmus lemmus]